jgi:REP element-mobilizing transposase RayT
VCISRCVRRAFLCGRDRYTGRSFDHRKPWLLERLALLTSVFAIDVAAYAIMSNHFHLVLHIDRARALSWSDDEVLHRWTRIYKGPPLVQKYLAGHTLDLFEMDLLAAETTAIRNKLASLSKFMAALNEYMARKANIEDGCTGRFWEGRFKSQALLDTTGLLSCMTYVDLNPVRAGIARGLDDSDFTSIQDRIRAIQGGTRSVPDRETETAGPAIKPSLMAFAEVEKEGRPDPELPFSLQDYLELADWTGRAVRNDKRGFIPADRPRILDRIGISDNQWRFLALELQKKSVLMLNGLEILAKAERRGAKRAAA